jgi:hypothetical protein
MKLPKSILIKDTTRLFLGKYKHKIVLVTPVASWFRTGDMQTIKSKISIVNTNISSKLKADNLKKYAVDVCDLLIAYQDQYSVRVENPRLSIYTNDVIFLEKLAKLDETFVKFVVVPNNKNPEVIQGVVLVKNLDFDFKVHVGTSRTNHSNFVEWSKNNAKIRMPKRCCRDLQRDRSWGGSYFYVKDPKTLTMVKMFLGADISKVETVVKA